MCCGECYTERIADVGPRPGKIKHNVSFYTVPWKIHRFTHLSWDWGRCLTTRPYSLRSIVLILYVVVALFVYFFHTCPLPSFLTLVFSHVLTLSVWKAASLAGVCVTESWKESSWYSLCIDDTSHSIIQKFNQSSLAGCCSAGTFSGSLEDWAEQKS